MTKQNNKKKLIIIIVAAVVLIAAATAGILVLTGVFNPKTNDSKGVVGVISDGWDTGIEDKGEQKKSGTRIPGYSTAEMNAGDKTLKISIGIKLDDGTVLYESELLKPGQGLTEVPLTQTLEKGEYNAVVAYQCVLLDEENTPLNAAESGFTLIVK